MHIRRFRAHRAFSLKGVWSFFTGQNFSKNTLFGGIFVVLSLFTYGTFFLPSVDKASELAFAESTIIYDRAALDPQNNPDEHILYIIHGDENREYIPLKEISPWVAKATIAIEDNSFYHHFGFDIGGIFKAVLSQFGIGRSRGGSTITQQLVKNTFLSPEKTLIRKFKEVLLSMKVEWHYSKDEILELYLNKIPYGQNAHGIEAAAKTFFGKSARDLTLAESAILASLPAAPTRFSPYGSNKDELMGYQDFNNPACPSGWCKGRKDLILQRMLELKMITFEEFKQAVNESKTITFHADKVDIKAPHFVFAVREKMEEKYGKEFLKQGGLRIYTTLDPEIQKVAEEVVATKTAIHPSTYGAHNAALATINTDTGEILAYIGGKDFFDLEHDGQVDVLRSRRQPGSTFKPIVYSAAFAQGYAPGTVEFDVETDFGGNYKPQNFTGKFEGPVSFRRALNESLNIPAIKAAYLATPQKVLEMAESLGIIYEGNAQIHGIALGIGVAEVQPLSIINAFQSFAGDGSYHEPTFILEVRDAQGKVLEKADFAKTKRPGVNPEIAALTRNILTDESTRPTRDGFNWNTLMQLDGYNNGCKTGTSNRSVKNPTFDETKPENSETNPLMVNVPGDAWTIGFTPHLVTGVWVGNNRGEPMKDGATGMALAAPIWKAVMTQAHEILVSRGVDKNKLYNEPKPLEVRKINKYSGKLATDSTPPSLVTEEVFASFALPTELDDSVKQIEIDKISGLPATAYTPYSARTLEYVLQLKSLRSDMPNWEKPVDEWLAAHPRFISSLGKIVDETPAEGSVEASLLERYRGRIPQDDVHNAYTKFNAPQIKIISPKAGRSLAPGMIEVLVDSSAKFGMKTVEFYLDNQLLGESHRFPFTGKFQIPQTLEMGSKHLLKVVALDRLFNMDSDEIEIMIAQDLEGPSIEFLGPIANEGLPLGAYVSVLTDIKDSGSAVKQIEFFLDETPLPPSNEDPHQSSFLVKGDLGRHFLKVVAIDVHENQSEKSIPLIFERERLITEDRPLIQDITYYQSSASVEIIFPLPQQIEFSELVVEKNKEVVFYQKLSRIPKFAQIQIPKNFEGKAKIKLMSKLQGLDEPYLSPVKDIEF